MGTRGMRRVHEGVQGGYKGYKVGTRGMRWVEGCEVYEGE